MAGFLWAIVLLGSLFAIWFGLRQTYIRNLTRKRLLEGQEALRRLRGSRSASAFGRRFWWLSLVFGAAVFFLSFFLFSFKLVYASAFALVAGLLFWQIQEIRLSARIGMIEEQLADVIDLMISGLQAGASAPSALESAVKETVSPIKPYMNELIGRLRYGDNPVDVFQDLGRRVPLETFKIFSVTMAIHWGTGGRLVPLLATVAKTIRDRIEISRQIRTQSTQARISTIVLLGAAYFIFAIVWRADPVYVQAFLNSLVGSFIAALALVLQALGIVWIHYLIRSRY